MHTSTLQNLKATITQGGVDRGSVSPELLARYQEIIREQRLYWTAHHDFLRRLGSGGQGIVFLSERRGSDAFTLPVAIKVFSPERYESDRCYDESMTRIGRVSSAVARIQHENLVNVQNFVDHRHVRMMIMEWVDGYDLQQLLVPKMLERIQHRVSTRRWEYINRVVVTAGPRQPRCKAGVAVAIVRDCLRALAALHRDGIVHSDIKPSNIMLKRTGHAKIVDIGSAYEAKNPPEHRACTPTYAAPEVLDGGEATPRSDLASLGYVLIELLAGQSPFLNITGYRALLEAKRRLPQQLSEMMPEEVSVNELLMNFCRRLIAPDPIRRFASAEAADLFKEGAAAFHRQLVLGNMSSEYDNEIRLWLEELKELDEIDDKRETTL